MSLESIYRNSIFTNPRHPRRRKELLQKNPDAPLFNAVKLGKATVIHKIFSKIQKCGLSLQTVSINAMLPKVTIAAMTFLHPGFLYALPLAVLPVLLHLISLRKPRIVELPTFRFLLESYRQERRRNRFLEILLAVLRSLFLAGFIFALSRPSTEKSALTGAFAQSADVAIVLDGSASMERKSDGSTAFERARRFATSAISQQRAGKRAAIFRAGGELELLGDNEKQTVAELARNIADARCGGTAVDWKRTLERLGERLNKSQAGTTVLVLTDAQASNWSSLFAADSASAATPKSTGAWPFGENDRVIVVDVAGSSPAKPRSVVVTTSDTTPALIGVPVAIHTSIRSPAEAGKAIEATCVIDKAEAQKINATLDRDGVGKVRFSFTPTKDGICRGEVSIPDDDFPADDKARFCVNVQSRLRLLLVNGRPSTDAFEDETHCFKAAMQCDGIVVREIPEWEITPRSLADADVTVLANAGGLSEQHGQWLRDAVGDGMGLLVFAGDRVDVESFNLRLLAGDPGSASPMTPARFLSPQGELGSASTYERIGWLDRNHPAFSAFEDGDSQPLASARLFRWQPLQLPPADGENRRQMPTVVVARLGSKTPILIESRFGRGIAMFGGWSLSSQWSNLPLKPDFVPLMLQMVRHAAGRGAISGPSEIAAGAKGECQLSPRATIGDASILDESNKAKPLAFDRAGDLLAAWFRPMEPGYGRVEVDVRSIRPRGIGVDPDRDAPAKGQSYFASPAVTRLEWGFGVNVDPAESDPTKVDFEKLKSAFGGKVQVIEANADTETAFHSGPSEIWLPILILVGINLAAEFLLATTGDRTAIKESPSASTSRSLREVFRVAISDMHFPSDLKG